MGLFIDLLHVPVRVCNDALEGIYKAMSDGHGHGDDGIWKPHQSPLLKRLVELFTQRGLDRLAAVKANLLDWQAGHLHQPSPVPAPLPAGNVQRWRVRDNLPGSRAFCPVIVRSEMVQQLEQYDCGKALNDLEVEFGADVLLRSAMWLTVKESRASFKISASIN